jgi:hypothetical protein
MSYHHDERRSGMTRNTSLKLKNKYVLLSMALLFGALVFQSWKDLLPKEQAIQNQRSFGFEHLVATPAGLSTLPDDARMAILDIGKIVEEDGKLSFVSNGLAPTVTAGREANLMIDMQNVPAGRLADAQSVIGQQIRAWRAKNIVMSTVFIKPSQEIVKDPEFFDFIASVFKENDTNYWLGVAIDYQALQQDPALRTILANTQRYVRDFVFFYPGQSGLKDLIPALEELRLPYTLVLDHDPEDLKALQSDLNALEIKHLQRFVIKR